MEHYKSIHDLARFIEVSQKSAKLLQNSDRIHENNGIIYQIVKQIKIIPNKVTYEHNSFTPHSYLKLFSSSSCLDFKTEYRL